MLAYELLDFQNLEAQLYNHIVCLILWIFFIAYFSPYFCLFFKRVPCAAVISATPPPLVVVCGHHNGSQGSILGSLNYQGGWLSIAPKLVPPIIIVCPLDTHKLCPFFCIEQSAQVLILLFLAYSVVPFGLFQLMHVLTTQLNQIYPEWVPP